MASTEPGRQVLEDLVRALLPELVEGSRQPDPAASVPPPEGGTDYPPDEADEADEADDDAVDSQ